ncbi:hypothetical protein BX666DRAFT_1963384 [Dichotomocladium elegans]|nr:hypothetical protein BX666DRAFT_1963384 [Dichotomocladium elegans]
MSNIDGSDSISSSSTIYVGNLDQRVTDTMLHDYFATTGEVTTVKIIASRRHAPQASVNYGFVEFATQAAAEKALSELNGQKLFDLELKLNWAQPQSKESDEHFHVFVGDLAREINDDMLAKAFSGFNTMSEAHVMWDANSGNSRGFGFVAFRDKTDAEQAIATMNGEWLGSRQIRCNWATQKGQMATPPPQPGQKLPYQVVINQAPAFVTNVYVGNLAPDVTESDLTQLFGQHGSVQEVKLQADRGYAFVKMDSHANAAKAIVKLQSATIHGRTAKLSWGKNRSTAGGHHHHQPQQHHLYVGRAGHNSRGAPHHGHFGQHVDTTASTTSPSSTSPTTLDDVAAPNSLASLDPHASGSLATAGGTAAPATITATNGQPEFYDYSNGGSVNI